MQWLDLREEIRHIDFWYICPLKHRIGAPNGGPIKNNQDTTTLPSPQERHATDQALGSREKPPIPSFQRALSANY